MSKDPFERLCETIAKPGIDSKVVQAVALQFVGGNNHPQEIGVSVRRDIHLAVVADANVNLSRFFTGLEDLLSDSESAHLSGTNTTHSGAIGSVKDGLLSRGSFLDESIFVSYVEQSDALDSRGVDGLQQVLNSRQYSFTKRGYLWARRRLNT